MSFATNEQTLRSRVAYRTGSVCPDMFVNAIKSGQLSNFIGKLRACSASEICSTKKRIIHFEISNHERRNADMFVKLGTCKKRVMKRFQRLVFCGMFLNLFPKVLLINLVFHII